MQDLSPFFKSIVENDAASVVICDTQHTVIYMNPAAVANYSARGGAQIIGRSIMDCHNPESCMRIREVTEWFAESPDHNKVHTFYSEKQNKDVYMIALRDADGNLIGYYEKHEFRTRDMTPVYSKSVQK